MNWESSADWLIANDTKQHNFSKTWRENKNGMWVVALRDDKVCFRYNGQVNNDGCVDVRKSQRAQQCNDWPNGWVASNDVVNACKKNAPIGSQVSINGTQVWAKWNVDDPKCVATPETWSPNECADPNKGTSWTKLKVPGKIDWAKAAADYSSSLRGKVVNGNTVTESSSRTDITGAYSTINFKDPKCVATPEKWSSPVCTPVNGFAKFWTKLSIPKGIDWKKAGNEYSSTLKTLNGRRVQSMYRQDNTGAYIDAIYFEPLCIPKSFILKKPYEKNENLGENIKGIPDRFSQAISNPVFIG